MPPHWPGVRAKFTYKGHVYQTERMDTPIADLVREEMRTLRRDIDEQTMEEALSPHDPHAAPFGIEYWLSHPHWYC